MYDCFRLIDHGWAPSNLGHASQIRARLRKWRAGLSKARRLVPSRSHRLALRAPLRPPLRPFPFDLIWAESPIWAATRWSATSAPRVCSLATSCSSSNGPPTPNPRSSTAAAQSVRFTAKQHTSSRARPAVGRAADARSPQAVTSAPGSRPSVTHRSRLLSSCCTLSLPAAAPLPCAQATPAPRHLDCLLTPLLWPRARRAR